MGKGAGFGSDCFNVDESDASHGPPLGKDQTLHLARDHNKSKAWQNGNARRFVAGFGLAEVDQTNGSASLPAVQHRSCRPGKPD